MVEIIVGQKGKGKTKALISKVNTEVRASSGSVVYIDKSGKHMFELDSKIRLINMSDYLVENTDEFIGFLCGVISQNNDIEEIFLDSFLTVAFIDTNNGLCDSLKKLETIGEKFNIKFVLSISKDESDLPECAKDKVILSL